MKIMEPLQVVSCMLPSVKIAADDDNEVPPITTPQSASGVDTNHHHHHHHHHHHRHHHVTTTTNEMGMEIDQGKADAATIDADETRTRLPNSVFRPRTNNNLHLVAPIPLTATRSLPLTGANWSMHPIADRDQLSGSQRKLHSAHDDPDDDDDDEDLRKLTASTQFDESDSDDSRSSSPQSQSQAQLASSSPSNFRKQSDCVVLGSTSNGNKNRLAVTTNDQSVDGQGRQLCRRTASFPIARNNAELCAKPYSHHVSHASSAAGIPIEIVPNLFIGDETASFNEQVLRGLNVTHVVNVTKRIPNWHEKSKDRPIKYLQIPINDHWSENLLPFLPQVVAFVDEARRDNCGAFIHCEAGVSRSATIIVAYVMQTFRMKLDDAYELVRSVKTDICPNFAFMMQLKDFEKQLGLATHDSNS